MGNIKVIKPEKNFEQVSWKAITSLDTLTLGVYVKLLAEGDKWNLNIRGLAKSLGLSEDKTRASIVNLERNGYLTRKAISSNGKLNGYEYIVYGNMIEEGERTHAGFSLQGYPKIGNPENDQPNNNILQNNTKKPISKDIVKETSLNSQQEEKEKSSAKRERELTFPYSSTKFMELWNDCLELKKWKGKTTHALQLSLDKLSKISEEDAIRALEQTLECGYQGVFVDKYPQITRKPIKNAWEQMGMTQEEYNQYMKR